MLRELADEFLNWQVIVDAFAQAHYGWEPWVALRSFAAIYLCACTLAFSLRATWIWLPGLGVPMRWGTVLAVGMWTSTAGFHVLRGLGLFNLPVALVACTLLLIASVRALPDRISLQRAGRYEWRALCRVVRLARRSRFSFTTGCFVAVGCLFAMRGLIIPPLGWDTFTYHGPRAALWLQTGQLTFDPGPSGYLLYRHFFAGGEVFMAWAMLPFHSDMLVNLATTVQWLGMGLSTWAIARQLGAREPYAATSAGLIMFAPVVLASLNSGYVDIVLAAALLQGIALAITCLRRFSAPVGLVAMMSMGVGAGIKLTGIAPAVVFAVPVALRALAEPSLRVKQKLAFLAAAVACALLPAAPWLWLAWSETGYPFSPIPIKIAGLTLGVSNSAVDWYNDRPHLLPYTFDFELMGLRSMFEPVSEFNPTLGILCLLPLVAFPFGLIVLARREAISALLLSAAVMSSVFMHFSPAMNTTRLLMKWSPARYLMASLALAFVVCSLVSRSRFRSLASAYRYLALLYPVHCIVLALRWGWGSWETRELLVVASGIALACVAVRSCSNLSRQLAAAVLLFAVGCSALQVRRDETRERAFASSYAVHGGGKYWTATMRYFDHKPRRFAITAGPNRHSDLWTAYHLLGSRLENRVLYVPPTRDGRVVDLDPHSDFDSHADPESWYARLLAEHVDAVMTFQPRGLEQDWMDAAPKRYRRLAGTEEWGFYKVLR